MTDTSPEIAALVRARLISLSGAERFVMGVRMCEAARRMVVASLPSDLPESERKRRLFERFQGRSLPDSAQAVSNVSKSTMKSPSTNICKSGSGRPSK